MSTRDDFPFRVKEALAKRAAYHCCYLGCGAVTIGPSDESDTATSSTGVACHITAAAPGKGAKRYDAAMTKEQRSDISNGLWACQLHSKLIDTDECRFTTEMLLRWREIGEGIARIMQARGLGYNEAMKLYDFSKLINASLEIKSESHENEIIADAIYNCGIVHAWGERAALETRDYFIELIKNAFKHGGASSAKFTIYENRITLEDDGEPFDSKALASKANKTGGIVTLRELLKNHDGRIIVASNREKDVNVNTVAFLSDPRMVLDITPCTYEFQATKVLGGSILDLATMGLCNEIYILIDGIITYSDIGLLRHAITALSEAPRPIIFITTESSALVQETLAESFPTASVINLPRLRK